MIFELCYIEAVFIVYKHCIFPRNEAAEKTDAGRVGNQGKGSTDWRVISAICEPLFCVIFSRRETRRPH